MSTTSSTRLCALIGDPVAHSLSPAIHSAGFSALGVDATYLAMPVAAADLPAAVAGLRALRAVGFNVTIPHKRAMLGLVDEVDAAAAAIGAINTVRCTDGRLVGFNTDASGLARSLEDAAVKLRGQRALVLGTGGAARASVVGLAQAGVASGVVAGRRPDAAHEVAALAGWEAVSLDELDRVFGDVDVLAQATSATLGAAAEAFASSLPIDRLPPHATVVDLVYKPLETTVLAAARARGLAVVDGLGMLTWQAALAEEIWFGRCPPIAVLRAAVGL